MSTKPAPKTRTRPSTWRLPVELLDRLKEYARKSTPRASVVAHVEEAIRQYLQSNDR